MVMVLPDSVLGFYWTITWMMYSPGWWTSSFVSVLVITSARFGRSSMSSLSTTITGVAGLVCFETLGLPALALFSVGPIARRCR